MSKSPPKGGKPAHQRTYRISATGKFVKVPASKPRAITLQMARKAVRKVTTKK